MIRQVTPKVAAIALGLAMVVSLVGAQSAHAGISVPRPPPSITDPPPPSSGPRGTGKTLAAENVVHDSGTSKEAPR